MQAKQASRVLTGLIIGAAVTWALRPRSGTSTQPNTSPLVPHDDPPAPVSPEPTALKTAPRQSLLAWLLTLLIVIAVASTATGAAIYLPIPGWARWAISGVALTAVVCLLLAVLLGPGARRLAGEHRPFTDQERRELSANERIEAVNSARHTLIQAVTGLIVIGGVIFTAQGLSYTAQTLDTAQQGQITDRYTKTIEQLGSDKLDIRLGGIYALERLVQDSPRDHQTIYDVLTAFIREHDPEIKAAPIKTGPSAKPTTDIQATLTVIGRRITTRDTSSLDLTEVRISGANLTSANLNGVNLTDANLTNTNLTKTKLAGANLTSADLTNANLTGANLTSAGLNGVNLTDANLATANLAKTNLAGVNLTRADLTSADLTNTNLAAATLTDTNLTSADLTNANLATANLTNTYLNYANLNSADLSYSDLTDTYLFGANLNNTDLTGANLTDANLFDADLTDAYLAKTELTGADLNNADLTGANLSTVNLSTVNLTGVTLTNANLTAATLTDTNLTGADLTGMTLIGADLTGVTLIGADLTGADLSYATLTNANLTGANLAGADLRGVVGISELRIRAVAKVDGDTRFGPL